MSPCWYIQFDELPHPSKHLGAKERLDARLYPPVPEKQPKRLRTKAPCPLWVDHFIEFICRLGSERAVGALVFKGILCQLCQVAVVMVDVAVVGVLLPLSVV